MAQKTVTATGNTKSEADQALTQVVSQWKVFMKNVKEGKRYIVQNSYGIWEAHVSLTYND